MSRKVVLLGAVRLVMTEMKPVFLMTNRRLVSPGGETMPTISGKLTAVPLVFVKSTRL